MITRVLVSSILIALLLSYVSAALRVASDARVVIYSFYMGCPICPHERERILQYIDELTVTLHSMGVKFVWVRDIWTDAQAERDLDELFYSLGVPEYMKEDVVVSVDEKFLFINFVPAKIICDFLANHIEEYGKIVVFRDELRDSYMIIGDAGQIVEGKIENSISECVKPTSSRLGPTWSTLLLILGTGLLDGINPCAFAVLLFFVTVLFTLSTTCSSGDMRRRILWLGSIYITAVYLTYLAIGLTLREVITMIPFPHLISKVAALVLIGAGVVNIKDRLWPGRGPSLKLFPSQWGTVRNWMNRTSLLAAFVLGVLVALFEFPCTGSIYVAIISVLGTRTAFIQGLAYLILYNLAFILPLTLILILASNSKIVEFSLREWREREEKQLRPMQGLIYIGLGALLFLAGFV